MSISIDKEDKGNKPEAQQEGHHTHAQVHHDAHTAPAAPPHHIQQEGPEQRKERIEKRNRELKYYGIGFAIYLIIALFMFYPITLNIGSLAPGIGGDTYQNIWNIWWVNYATFTLHTSMFQTNFLFWPVGSNLVYQTFSPLAALLSVPFQVAGLVAAYNVLFFLGFAISGICMFALARYITKEIYGAFIAGLVFTFSAFHIIQSYSHMHLLFIGWVPLALLFFLRFLDNHGNRHINAAGAAISFTLATFMASYEVGIMVLLLFFAVFCAYLISKEKRNLILSRKFAIFAGEFVVIALVLGAWAYPTTIATVTSPGGLSTINNLNTVANEQSWSYDILSFFLPSPYNGLFNGLSNSYSYILAPDVTAREAYIGYVVLALVVYELVNGWKKEKLWLGIAAIFLIFCLGPNIQIAGIATGIPSLYSLYRLVPLLNIVREPGRFFIVASVGLSVIAALGVKRLHESMKSSGKLTFNKWAAVFGIIVVLFLIENNGTPTSSQMLNQITTHISVPKFYYELASYPGNFSVLSLPALPNAASALLPNLYTGMATYYSAISKKPLVGGYTSRENTTQELSVYNIPLAVQATELEENVTPAYQTPVNQSTTNQTVLTLFNYNVGAIPVNKGAYSPSSLVTLEDYMAAVFGSPIYNDNTTIVFSTQNAITNSVFRSFVAYPSLSEWGEAQSFVNGTLTNFWTPVNGSASVVVYAPYANPSNMTFQSMTSPSRQQFVNATIRFDALYGGGPVQLQIYAVQGASPVRIATINLTTALSEYSINTSMVSGPYGNQYIFLPVTQSSLASSASVGITNMRFGYAK
jgi:hypothetical protein